MDTMCDNTNKNSTIDKSSSNICNSVTATTTAPHCQKLETILEQQKRPLGDFDQQKQKMDDKGDNQSVASQKMSGEFVTLDISKFSADGHTQNLLTIDDDLVLSIDQVPPIDNFTNPCAMINNEQTPLLIFSPPYDNEKDHGVTSCDLDDEQERPHHSNSTTKATPILSKTFTEPANLSELLKNLSSNLHSKLFGGAFPSSRIGAVVVPDYSSGAGVHNGSGSNTNNNNNGPNGGPNRNPNVTNGAQNNGRTNSIRKTSPGPGLALDAEEQRVLIDCDVGPGAKTVPNNVKQAFYDDDSERFFIGTKNRKISLESKLRHGSSSFALNQSTECSSKVNSICSQCPRCRRHGRASTLVTQIGHFGGGRDCGCRICRILDPATSPTLITKQLPSSESQELGALCQLCGQSGNAQSTGRCLRFTNSTGQSQQPSQTEPNNGPPETGSTYLATSVSFNSGQVTSREQGVQVSKWSLSSISSCSGPLCRICHSPGDKVEPLMSPCRCSGSLKYVHASCLLRWLEISRRKLHRAPHCELCGYKYQRHKIMRFRRFQCPPCSRRDKLLHFTFVLAILIMVICASTTIICFKAERGQKIPSDKIELTSQEVVTLVCGVMFFCAFFLAMYVQVKAQATIYKLMLRFWLMNQEWQIEEYRRERDLEYCEKYRPITSLTIPDARSTSV